MSALERQLWINGAAKFCQHRWEEVRSEDETVLYGRRCACCGANYALGQCDGCELNGRRLALATPSGRFCDEECEVLARKRRQKRAREDAAEVETWRCEHTQTEGVQAGDGHQIGVRCTGCGRAFEGAGP